MCLIRMLAAIAAVSFSMAAQATIFATPCNHCDSDAQWEQRAWNSPPGKHYFYNFDSNQIRRYEKGEQSQVGFQPGGGGEVVVVRLPVPQIVDDSFHATQHFWVLNNHQLDIDIEVELDPSAPNYPPILVGKNAFDIVGSSTLKSWLERYTFEAQAWDFMGVTPSTRYQKAVMAFMGLIQSAGDISLVHIAFGNEIAEGNFIMVFPDGAKVTILFADGDFSYVPNKSFDSNGNPIPESGFYGLHEYYRFADDPSGFYDWKDYVEKTMFWELLDGSYDACVMMQCDAVSMPSPLTAGEADNTSKISDASGSSNFYNAPQLLCHCTQWQ